MSGGPTMAAEIVVPKRQLFKAVEVCTIAGVQPYILQSWEAEFPMLAPPKKKGGARVYRRTDVELVLQIKHLVFGEGLTLGAAHRQIETSKEPAGESPQPDLLSEVLEADLRERIADIKGALRDILRLLSANGEVAVAPQRVVGASQAEKDQKQPPKLGVSRPVKVIKKTAAKTKKGATRKRSA